MTRREAAARLHDATAQLLAAGLLRLHPFETNSQDEPSIHCQVCGGIDEHVSDCSALDRLTKLAQGAA